VVVKGTQILRYWACLTSHTDALFDPLLFYLHDILLTLDSLNVIAMHFVLTLRVCPPPYSQDKLQMWVPDALDVWRLAKVVERNDTDNTVTVAGVGSSGNQETFNLNHSNLEQRPHPYDPSHDSDLDDLALLNNLHEVLSKCGAGDGNPAMLTRHLPTLCIPIAM